MIEIRVDAVAYSDGKPVTFVATAAYSLDENNTRRISGGKSDTKEDAIRNLIRECRELNRVTNEVINMYNFIRTD